MNQLLKTYIAPTLSSLLMIMGGSYSAIDVVKAETVVVGHRGGYSQWTPENTLVCITRSFSKGVWGHEVDVRITADGDLITLHDATVDRTTNGTGSVGSLTTSYIRSLDAGGWKGSEFEGEKVPFLSEVLSTIKGNGTRAYLDIKNASSNGVLTVVNNVDFPHERLTFLTFYNSQSSSFISLFPTADVFQSLYGDPYDGELTDSKLTSFSNLGIKGVTIHYLHFSQEYVDAIHAVGLKVAVVRPGKIQSDEEMQNYISAGVDEVWLDDVENHVLAFNTGSGILKTPPPFQVNLVEVQQNGEVHINWNSVTNKKYRIESSEDLATWTVINSSFTAGLGQRSYFIDTDKYAAGSKRFYKVFLLEE